MPANYTVYILECADKTLYTGSTINVDKRVREHNACRSGAKYTRSRRPVRLVHSERFRTLGKARKREVAIKRLAREEKIKLILGSLV